MADVHVGDIGVLITFKTREDLSTATTHDLDYKKPDGTTGTWTATVSGSDLLYTSIAGDFNQAGPYEVQAHVITPTWAGHTDSDHFEVKANVK
jgi:hypothetical protein